MRRGNTELALRAYVHTVSTSMSNRHGWKGTILDLGHRPKAPAQRDLSLVTGSNPRLSESMGSEYVILPRAPPPPRTQVPRSWPRSNPPPRAPAHESNVRSEDDILPRASSPWRPWGPLSPSPVRMPSPVPLPSPPWVSLPFLPLSSPPPPSPPPMTEVPEFWSTRTPAPRPRSASIVAVFRDKTSTSSTRIPALPRGPRHPALRAFTTTPQPPSYVAGYDSNSSSRAREVRRYARYAPRSPSPEETSEEWVTLRWSATTHSSLHYHETQATPSLGWKLENRYQDESYVQALPARK
ncbi:hypothetical protein BOTBODRAFT_38678 [Botryobasidium botryosum FD-172 SS1]|uniref:Uncharacterized protein n=1 Tax=Botryobasidium botryosum (strain FD-172 SS1) TaxID=930990 RepID=A0A067M7M8_BOTB1|nr:hypothetical protein BOTBODRAFT_38678 [Botryobasidium botryosum FD-172 SS1]